jgi:hypothetical protein
MNKPMIGIALGAVLGAIDGSTAWFTPEARSMMATIIMGSTIKGVMTGVVAGLVARKLHSIPWGTVIGLIVGLILSWWVAWMQGKYYFEIMLPGSMVGAIVGFATQKLPKPSTA